MSGPREDRVRPGSQQAGTDGRPGQPGQFQAAGGCGCPQFSERRIDGLMPGAP